MAHHSKEAAIPGKSKTHSKLMPLRTKPMLHNARSEDQNATELTKSRSAQIAHADRTPDWT
jgi:hypothetical protein